MTMNENIEKETLTNNKPLDYIEVTELAGEDVSQEQVDRICHRYFWAQGYCEGKDVIEVACGSGQGLGCLAKVANKVVAGDYSDAILNTARSHYQERIKLMQFDAQNMPFEDHSYDVIIIFEAIYYLPEAEKFMRECKRVLRPGGMVLIATANKDLYDFNPSPHSYTYYGVRELDSLLRHCGFTSSFFGTVDTAQVSLKQKVFRPIKKVVVASGLMPKTMKGKKLLKRFVFGKLIKMPAEIEAEMTSYQVPTVLSSERPDTRHKVIYCAATLKN